MAVSDGSFQDRRNFLSNALLVGMSSITATSMLTIGSTPPAYADVADGTDLPKGVAQFGRIVRAKVELLVSCSRAMQQEFSDSVMMVSFMKQ